VTDVVEISQPASGAAPPRTLVGVLRETFRVSRRRALPQRIVDQIRKHDLISEVLVKLIQILVVGILGIFYIVSPKTDAGTEFSPVPWALAIYLVLNGAGLYWALRRGLPDWSVYVSIGFDVSLLMILIWSFHIQYEQPPSFYLKVPTLLYAFIFIALRALRFESKFVLAAGGFAALGWLLMAGYAILADPRGNVITRNYVHYITDNAVLVGAELDKIISFILVAAVLGLALRRAHGFLVDAIAEGISVRDFSRFFDQSVADRIRSADRQAMAGEGARRWAAVLFVDIRGFTPMASRMDPGDVVSLLTAYQAKIVPLIQSHGGTIDKFLGDGIMATFGAAGESATSAADALRAVDAVIAESDRWISDPVLSRLPRGAVNAAVAAGPVVFGVLGNEQRVEYTVIGAAVNLAAKLEKFNRDAGVRANADAETFARALAQGYVPSREPRHIEKRVADVDDIVVLHERFAA
jgi:adenylate cyclase